MSFGGQSAAVRGGSEERAPRWQRRCVGRDERRAPACARLGDRPGESDSSLRHALHFREETRVLEGLPASAKASAAMGGIEERHN